MEMKFFYLLGIVFSITIMANESASIPEKEIVIVSASRNNKKYYEKNLESTLNQNYKNYRIIWIDDASPDGTGRLVEEYLKKNDPTGKVTLVKNEVRVGSMENFYKAIYSCKASDIIVVVDGDDWLAHNNSLQSINKAYQDKNVWLTYGDYKPFLPSNDHYSYEIPKNVLMQNSIRNYNWTTSHVKTFYSWLFRCINVEDLKYKNEFATTCTDLAMMFPMIEMAGFHTKFINEVLYVFNNETDFNEFKVYSKLVSDYDRYVHSLKKYAPLEKAPEYVK